ncbi:5'-methylthioadenosine/S-adenosylhomocysteine nucleosidase [Specibacter sp. NPDC057265]|uniref:5'-methylthioadenosine/S-adenosylhomocysteine nucleosidase n=1 Tax=Specibacter sp. NPDC057265 TaxID=3346075 RepID=UPI0036356C74
MTTSRIAPVDVIIIAAMEPEIIPFLNQATELGEPRQVGNAVLYSGLLAGRRALFVRGGIGLVNAAGAANSALLLAGGEVPPLVISAGTAGGLGADVRVGDVVIGTEMINADADARAFGYVLGQVPGMPASYPSPGPAIQAGLDGVPTERTAATVHHGVVVSSYSFVGHDRAPIIKGQFAGVLATDMESSAIAQTCHVHGAPFLAVRGISDLCGPASEADFIEHVDDAAERSAEVAIPVIAAWWAAQAG